MSSDAPGLCSTPGLSEVILIFFKFLKRIDTALTRIGNAREMSMQ